MDAAKYIQPRAYSRREGSAFSLIELVLVLTIISILAAVAVPRYAGALSRYRADAAARRVVADLSYARQAARSSSTSVTVMFKTLQDRIEMESVQDLDDSSSAWVTDLGGRPFRADLVSADFSGIKKVVYDGYGQPDSGGFVVLAVGSETRTVVVDPDTEKAGVQ
jgi:prepilin-type N-terminal cleavage/methylation domain-containing protein